MMMGEQGHIACGLSWTVLRAKLGRIASGGMVGWEMINAIRLHKYDSIMSGGKYERINEMIQIEADKGDMSIDGKIVGGGHP